jgi:hypothetical protein
MALNGKQFYVISLNVCLMVFNATFNNISVYIMAVSFIDGETDLIVNTLIKKRVQQHNLIIALTRSM